MSLSLSLYHYIKPTSEVININRVVFRKSGIELLKVIAMFMICFFHASQTINNLTEVATFYNYVFWLGQFGNIIFVVCSSWFLLQSHSNKIEKALNILFDSMLISIIILIIFLSSKRLDFSWDLLIKNVFPDIFFNVWFIPNYVLFYLLHPLFNLIIKHLDKKLYFGFVIVCLLLLIILGFFDFAIGMPFGAFVIIYFIVGFIRKYGPCSLKRRKTILITLFVSIILTVCLLIIKQFYPNFGAYIFVNMYNIFSLVISLCLFGIFYKIKFYSNFINALYELSLLNDINYNGTMAQFNAINKAETWVSYTLDTLTVHCTDGDIPVYN